MSKSLPTRVHALVLALCITMGVGGPSVALPAAASAYATLAPPPAYSTASGLPDERVYEQVTPPNKYGNFVAEYGFRGSSFGLAAADGQAVIYEGTGPLAEGASHGNSDSLSISQRTSHGWVTRSALPGGALGLKSPEENNGFFTSDVFWFDPSADLSRIAFATLQGADVAPPDELGLANNLYLTGSDTSIEPEWIARPQMENPVMEHSTPPTAIPVGGSPNLDVIYFQYPGVLLPEVPGRPASGLYEYRNGVLSDAGVLPEGVASPSAAIPAAEISPEGGRSEGGNISPSSFDNQVSADGSRVFFVRANASGTGELYVHVTDANGAQRTLLISQSQLGGHLGEPAPDGPLSVFSSEWQGQGEVHKKGQMSDVYASPDGSHAFFQSIDRLTSAAPAGNAPKLYDFDIDTGGLEYLPGVVGTIVSSSPDGSSFSFENTSATPAELDRWSAGPPGGAVTSVVQLPDIGSPCGAPCVGPAYTSRDGAVVVFSTEAPIAGFNDGGGFTQVFRYDATADELDCVSCPPAGIAPTGDAVTSNVDELLNAINASAGFYTTTDDRGASADDSRVFFDTPDPLVARDVNGKRDVYEWENGAIFMLSSGTSPENSIYIDSGEAGKDVFFTTTANLVQSDNDGGRDMYDARVPRPGDVPPPTSVPCQGDVCQGPPSVPELLGSPASAVFNGVGNLAAEAPLKPAVKQSKATKKTKQKSAKQKSAKKKHAKQKPKRPKAKGGKAKQSSRKAMQGDRGGK